MQAGVRFAFPPDFEGMETCRKRRAIALRGITSTSQRGSTGSKSTVQLEIAKRVGFLSPARP